MHINEGTVIYTFGEFEVQDTHNCGGFAPHHTVYRYKEEDVVRALLKSEIQVLVFSYIIEKFQ